MKRHAISHGTTLNEDGTPHYAVRCIACDWTVEGDEREPVDQAALEHSETEDDAPVTG